MNVFINPIVELTVRIRECPEVGESPRIFCLYANQVQALLRQEAQHKGWTDGEIENALAALEGGAGEDGEQMVILA